MHQAASSELPKSEKLTFGVPQGLSRPQTHQMRDYLRKLWLETGVVEIAHQRAGRKHGDCA